MKTTSVALGPYFEDFIKAQIAQGRYNNTLKGTWQQNNFKPSLGMRIIKMLPIGNAKGSIKHIR